ncbi:MAG: hypothetical protein JWO48_2001 [Bryobacterales bacterium]|nr:hypothetical protein [Bryobacterales bacterium]
MAAIDHNWNAFAPTRRRVLAIVAGAITGSIRLYAFSSDFWNKKDPSQWSSTEIEQLTSKSPWAKEVSAESSSEQRDDGDMSGPRSRGGGGGGGGMGAPRIGGMGIPGMGGGGMGRGRGRGGRQAAQSFKATIRWESAKPILEALKTPLPEAFADHYVISVSGLPMNSGRRGTTRDQEDQNAPSSSQPADDMLDHLKAVTFLEPKGREGAQPGIAQRQPSFAGGSVLFGFSKEILALKPDDKEVTFSTRVGSSNIKTKFNLKDMVYHGELAA